MLLFFCRVNWNESGMGYLVMLENKNEYRYQQKYRISLRGDMYNFTDTVDGNQIPDDEIQAKYHKHIKKHNLPNADPVYCKGIAGGRYSAQFFTLCAIGMTCSTGGTFRRWKLVEICSDGDDFDFDSMNKFLCGKYNFSCSS